MAEPAPVAPLPIAPLPTASPGAEGVDAGGVLDLVAALERRAGVEPHGLTLVRHGRVVASGHWAPYRRDAPRLLYSLSKSFTATAAGLMVGEGRLDPDDRVVDHFPEYADLVTDARVRSWRVRHLLSMATGHTEDTAARIFGGDEDPVRCFLQQSPEREPGTVFSYNQGATYTVAAIVQRLAGVSLVDYLRPRVFDAVGIGPVAWLEDPPGRSIGFSGLHAAHDDVVRLGLLHLWRGRWNGRQVLPAAWVDAATRTQIGTPGEPNPDWQQGYGYQFWTGRHGYRGDGAYGQFCLVLPEHDAVLVLTSATVGMQGVLDDVYRHLLPALTEQPLTGATDEELSGRLAGLTLPVPAGAAEPVDPSAWDGLRLAPRDGVCRLQPSLTEVRVRRGCSDSADPAWELTLVEGDLSMSVAVRRQWQAAPVPVVGGAGSIPVAAAGGFQPNGELRVHVRFPETPHTLVVVAHPGLRTFRVLWPTIPLHGTPLHALRAPRPLG